jgi:hypothetical protein
MTVSASRRALRQLFGGDREPSPEPLPRDGYSVAHRVIANLLGVRLAEPHWEEQLGPFRAGRVDSIDVGATPEAYQGGKAAEEVPHDIDRDNHSFTIIFSLRPTVHYLVADFDLGRARNLVIDLDNALYLADFENRASDLDRARACVRSLDRLIGLSMAVTSDHTLASALNNALQLIDFHNLSFDRAHELAVGNALGLILARASELAIEVARNLDRDHDYAEGFALPDDGNLNLVRARNMARSLAVNLSHADYLSDYFIFIRAERIVPDSKIVITLGRVLDSISSLAQDYLDELARILDRIAQDVSGVDLTGIRFEDREALVGVIWNDQTRWPPSVEPWVREHSKEIGPGRYQISRGSEREDASLMWS